MGAILHTNGGSLIPASLTCCAEQWHGYILIYVPATVRT